MNLAPRPECIPRYCRTHSPKAATFQQASTVVVIRTSHNFDKRSHTRPINTPASMTGFIMSRAAHSITADFAPTPYVCGLGADGTFGSVSDTPSTTGELKVRGLGRDLQVPSGFLRPAPACACRRGRATPQGSRRSSCVTSRARTGQPPGSPGRLPRGGAAVAARASTQKSATCHRREMRR